MEIFAEERRLTERNEFALDTGLDCPEAGILVDVRTIDFIEAGVVQLTSRAGRIETGFDVQD